MAIPETHQAFLDAASKKLANDPRIVGVAAGGSYLTGTMDDFSDVDLVIVVEPSAFHALLEERRVIAATLGPLLAAFTGEHVGEPRLLICLYGSPLLHVDLKFVAATDVATRVEDPAILFERDGRVTNALATHDARSCLDALDATIGLYRDVRRPGVVANVAAERESIAYVAGIRKHLRLR